MKILTLNSYDPACYAKLTPQTWDAKRCAKEAKTRGKDVYGTRYPFAGYVPGLKSGAQRFNGGCIVKDGAVCYGLGESGNWFPGVIHTLPILADGFKWVHIATWGWRIVKDSEKTT